MYWRYTREYRIWRAKVIRRDKRCVICGSIKNRQAHHLNHGSYFPDERFDVIMVSVYAKFVIHSFIVILKEASGRNALKKTLKTLKIWCLTSKRNFKT